MSRTTRFAVAAVGFLTVFADSGTPIPLYRRYREQGLVTTAQLSLTAVAYFLAAMTALLFFARLSDHVGRRPVAIATVLLAAGGCLVLVETNGIGLLITGRVLQGLACGLAPGALGAYIVDTVPIKSRWMVPAITGSGSMMSDGWDGHEPVQASHVFIPHLEENGSRIRIAESPAISSCR